MRRTVAVVCIALGVFCLALAPMLRYWMAESLMRAPLDQYSRTVNHGEGVTYFNAEEMESIENATVEAYTTVRGDVAASSDDIAVWDQFTWVEDIERDFAFQSTYRRAGHDRVTGEGVDCCDASVNDDAVEQSGQIYKFPFLTEQRDYEFFDTTSRLTRPITFEGVEEVNGVETYRFEQVIEDVKIGERTLPADLLGMDQEGDVTGDEMYSITRTYWIEPTTGAPIGLSEDQHRAVVVDGEERLVLFDGEMVWDEQTIENNIENARQGMTVLPLLRTTLPIVLLVAGVALVALGGVLMIGTGDRRERY
ncbi:DUF3068 domain-containing protein [Streptomonospora nanhaiensis]|uniref:DUF3068 domain-containing protein n=1 Tax=Streptomonospora nanhaiensis TaxID=1323731 RepID=A0A853BMT9_9ACTN|nr:DUF3068 domain-containing protein [Streptomonospora nanhaiensis]MBV2362144.1 DUF3068 domain-containing protein [Streptomonospora nanhaiensis]MBV2364784.1 DUF3068 domain-containing protein [Streptomonospora nanhaiensis]MBX9390852.1 DUF3068 domain-containing protein [Streptomonospora nanhaiensis]NYI96025.1 hypothetical protein [Streptomonospora nanhaiensis]